MYKPISQPKYKVCVWYKYITLLTPIYVFPNEWSLISMGDGEFKNFWTQIYNLTSGYPVPRF